jgi:hypothetical protein
MARPKTDSTVLTIRVPASLDRRLAREARRHRVTRSEVARTLLGAGLRGGAPAFAAEERRRSLLASRQSSELDTLDFLLHVADTTGRK